MELQWLQNHQGLELHILNISGEICPKFLAYQVAVALVLVHYVAGQYVILEWHRPELFCLYSNDYL